MGAKENAVLLMIKGVISDLPPEDQADVKDAAQKIRAIVAEAGDHGVLALGLVGAEAAVQSEA